MDYRIILPQLCALAGPSGFVRAVAEAAAQLLAPGMDAVQIQKMGGGVEKKMHLDLYWMPT